MKGDEHLITFKSVSNRSQIDYLLGRSTYHMFCKNCEVILGESVAIQHRLLVLNVRIIERHGIRKDLKTLEIDSGTLRMRNLRSLKRK